MKTIAAILEKCNEPLRLEEVEIPELKTGQVLVRIDHSGICHSQINEITGARGEDRFLPHTLGHEGEGEVLESGPGVTKVKAGDRVVATWLKGAGLDGGPVVYHRKGTKINSGPISVFLGEAVISENRLVPIFKYPGKAAALLGCAIPTGFGMVAGRLSGKQINTVVIWGAGGVGLSALLGASSHGCKQIIMVDVEDEKLDLALSLGATHTVNPLKSDPVAEIKRLTGGMGADWAFECVGKAETFNLALASVKCFGGHFVLAGNPPVNIPVQLDPYELIKGKKLEGTWGGDVNPDEKIPDYLQMNESGKICLDHLLGATFPLFNINEAIDHMQKGKTGRVMLAHHGMHE